MSHTLDDFITRQQTVKAKTNEIVGLLQKVDADQRQTAVEAIRKHFRIVQGDLRTVRRSESAYQEILEWFKQIAPGMPWRFQDIDTSVIHQLQETGTTVASDDDGRADTSNIIGTLTEAQVFLIRHDWAAAFKNAEGIDGDVALPYPFCAFEFSIGGKRGVAVCRDGNLLPDTFMRMRDAWVHLERQIDISPIRELVRCACIALEAQVAVTDITRAPERLNKRRLEHGRPPLRDFHVVKLNDKHRYARAETVGVDGRRGPRLHFRRAHDRHYATYKVRIPWTLVGNPDLGFIDKEYRL